MKKLPLIIVLSSLLLNSCVSYTHVMDAPQLTSAEKGLTKDAFEYKCTYTMGGFVNKNNSNIENNTYINNGTNFNNNTNFKVINNNSKVINDLQIIDTPMSNSFEPTYNSIVNKVHQVFGKDATFANVVWDIKHTNFLGFKGQKFTSVMFDVYVPIQK
jgi:hypothetical protein